MNSREISTAIPNELSETLRSVVSVSFQILLFLLLFLPSGTLFGVNIKAIFLALFLLVFLFYLIGSSDTFGFSDAMFLTAVLSFLGLWTFIGVFYGTADVLQVFIELRDFGTTIFIAWLSIFLLRNRVMTAERLITVVVYAVFALAVFKLMLVTLPFLINIDVFERIQAVFGEGFLVTGDIGFGIFRMEFSADILAPFALFALLAPRISGIHFGRIFKSIAVVVILTSGFIAFSRYIWFVFAVAILTAAVIEGNWKMPLLTALAALLIGLPLYDFFDNALVLRFQSEAAAASDDIRLEQYTALIEAFQNHPILGSGLGARAKEVLRNDVFSYSYELQWLAFLMQFGIVGMSGLLLLVLTSARDIWQARHPARIGIVLLFVLWLCSGFTNPYLTTSFAGGTFALFMAIFYRMRNAPIAGPSEAIGFV